MIDAAQLSYIAELSEPQQIGRDEAVQQCGAE